jgi:hypothetical protein
MAEGTEAAGGAAAILAVPVPTTIRLSVNGVKPGIYAELVGGMFQFIMLNGIDK